MSIDFLFLSGQLFFNKCGDPPVGCECTYEEPKSKIKIQKIGRYKNDKILEGILEAAIDIYNISISTDKE